jgi:hypothetical protein
VFGYACKLIISHSLPSRTSTFPHTDNHIYQETIYTCTEPLLRARAKQRTGSAPGFFEESVSPWARVPDRATPEKCWTDTHTDEGRSDIFSFLKRESNEVRKDFFIIRVIKDFRITSSSLPHKKLKSMARRFGSLFVCLFVRPSVSVDLSLSVLSCLFSFSIFSLYLYLLYIYFSLLHKHMCWAEYSRERQRDGQKARWRNHEKERKRCV